MKTEITGQKIKKLAFASFSAMQMVGLEGYGTLLLVYGNLR